MRTGSPLCGLVWSSIPCVDGYVGEMDQNVTDQMWSCAFEGHRSFSITFLNLYIEMYNVRGYCFVCAWNVLFCALVSLQNSLFLLV